MNLVGREDAHVSPISCKFLTESPSRQPASQHASQALMSRWYLGRLKISFKQAVLGEIVTSASYVVIPDLLKPVAGCRKMTGRPFLGRSCSLLTRRRWRQPPTTNFTVEKRKWSWHQVAVAAAEPAADAEVSAPALEGGRGKKFMEGLEQPNLGEPHRRAAPSLLSEM